MKRVFHNVKQNSDEWFDLRLGKITSSNFDKIMANSMKNGEFNPDAAFGKPAIEYARKVAHEIVTGTRDLNGFSNSYFDRGHEYEHVAIDLYRRETLYNVTNGGFYEIEMFGDSPDGNIGQNGCLEVKTAIEKVHWQTKEKGGYDTSYKWQIQGHMFIGDKKWCDFVRFCPEFYEPKRLYIYRVERDELMIDWLKSRLVSFWMLVKEKVKILKNYD